MKKFITSIFALALIATTSFAHSDKGRLTVNEKNSTFNWTGSKITGDKHSGTLTVKSGSISVDKGNIVSANIAIDMLSMTCTDDMHQRAKIKFIGHLESPDFFNTAEHSTAYFVLSSFDKGKDGNYIVKGKLTIKGITNDISFPAKAAVSDSGVSLDADVVFDRSKYDIQYGSGSFFEGLGDNLINDNVMVKLHIEAS